MPEAANTQFKTVAMPRSFLPISGLQSPRFAGPAMFMRLPAVDPSGREANDVAVGFIGVPWGRRHDEPARRAPRPASAP